MRCLSLFAAVLVACVNPKPTPAPSTTPSSGGPMQMQPWTAPPMERGADLVPADALVAWLESTRAGEGRLVRIPVAIARADNGFQLGEAWLAGDRTPPAADAVRVRLSDSALGVSLHDRVEEHCPDRTVACVLWLTGHWNGADTERAGSWRFSIRHVDGVVGSGDEVGAFGEVR